MHLNDILAKIKELSAEERDQLRRELEGNFHQEHDVSPEMRSAIQAEEKTGDECGLPAQDLVSEDPAREKA